MAKKTRFGLEGYGVRRAGSFSGKTASTVVVVTTTVPSVSDFDDLIQAQLDGNTVRAAYLVYFDFRSGPVRGWPGFGNLSIAGLTYQGLGNLSVLSPISAGPGGAVEEITLSLAGSDALLANLRSDNTESVGRELSVFLQFFDIRRFDELGNWVDWQPLSTPLSLFVGRMGPLSVKRQPPDPENGGATRVVSVSAQNILVNRARPPFQFYSDRDQKARSPDDNMFLRISRYAENPTRWPTF